MNLLAIETSTDACSVALAVGDDALDVARDGIRVRVDHRVEPRRHAQLVLPMIDALLAEAGLARGALDGVAFGRGPGSFTGVRIAASVTQGIALGLDIGVVGVSTLRAIAEGCRRELGDTRVGVALDARLDEIYWGAFEARGGIMRSALDERVCVPGSATVERSAEAGEARSSGDGDGDGDGDGSDGRGWTLAGPGAERYADVLRTALGASPGLAVREGRMPNARDTLTLARFEIATHGLSDPESAVPVYLRERVALTEEERGVRTVR